MAIQLAEMGANEEFHPENYRDEAKERIRGLIQKKIEGEEITNAEADEPKAQVIDLMEALRRSLGGASAKTKAAHAPKAASKAPARAEAKRKPAKAAPREVKARTRARS
jgi:DNA end-binding protein Ku